MSSIEINDIQDRQMDKATSNKEEVSTKEREKGEIIDLISEDIVMEANKPDSNNTNKEEKVSKETERLEQLDVSINNQENINNVKKKNKQERIQEIKQQVQHNTPTNSAPDKLKKIEKHILLMEGFESFKIDDLVNEIASIEAVTKLVNLLDVFPKLRTAFAQKLKLTPATTTNTIINIITAISNNKIVKVRGKIEDADAIILLDSCACLNMITKSALEKFKINKNPIGKISETIFQAFNMTEVETEIYELKVTIGSHTSYEQFRVIDNNEIFDILIGINSLKENKFILDFAKSLLYYNNENDEPVKIANMTYDIALPGKDIAKKNENSDQYLFLTLEKEEQINENVDKKFKIISNIICTLPEKIKNSAKGLFHKFSNVLAVKTDDLGETKLLPHRIELLPGTKPIKQRSYRLSGVQAGALKEILTKLLKNNLIEPSHSSWSSPVVLVPKKNDDYRMCVDYRKLNDCSIKDAYSLILIDDILYSVGKDTKMLSTLDLFSGYHQVPMLLEDRDKTCFTTMYGNYNFKVMPFGLCNAPATFQREMNRIFFKLIGICIFVYIDDLIVFSTSIEEQIKHL